MREALPQTGESALPSASATESATGAATLMGAALITASFALISFNPLSAHYTALTSDSAFHLTDNTAADQQKNVTNTSALGYLLLGGGGALAGLMSWRRRGRLSLAVLLTLLGYVALCYASVLWTAAPTLTTRKLAVLTLFLAGSGGLVQWLGLRGFAMACGVAAAATCVIGVLAELKIGMFRPWAGGYRFSGVVHPNEQSIYSAVLCMAAVFLLWPKPRFRVLAVVLLVAGAGLLVLTKSRSGLGGCVLASMIGLMFRARPSTKVLLGGLGAVAIGALAAIVASEGVYGLLGIASLGRAEHVGTLTGRVPLWDLLLGEAADRPLLGHGYGGFWTARNIEDISAEFYWHIPQAHSIYVDVLLNLGAIGLVAFLAMLLSGLASAARGYRIGGDEQFLFAGSMIVLAAIHGLTESKFFSTGFPAFVLFGSLAGLAIAGGRTATEDETENQAAPAGPFIPANPPPFPDNGGGLSPA